MNRCIKLCLPVFLIVGATVAIRFFIPGEPAHQGKPLSAWLADLDLESSHSTDTAVYALRAIGTNSFPWLTQMLRAKDPVWKQAVLSFNTRQSFLRIPVTPASVVQNRAIQGYIALGNVAKDNVPALIQILDSEPSPQIRSCVAAALGGIGPEAKAAIPALSRATADKSAEVRKNAFWALASIHRWSPDVPEGRFSN